MRRLLVALVVVLSVAGCGGQREPGTSPTSPPRPSRTMSSDAAELQLRVVALAKDVGSTSGREGLAATWTHRYAAFTCDSGLAARPSPPEDYLLACRGSTDKYLLEPAAWHGTVEDAAAVIPEQQAVWAVNVTLSADGAATLGRLSRELMESGGEVAIVVDGKVVSIAGFDGVITDGELQITPFDEAGANAFADRLTGS